MPQIPPYDNDEKMLALGRVTRSMIHDFNNTLGSILGYAEFLKTDLDKESEAYLFAHNIHQAASEMQALLEELRSFSTETKTPEKPALQNIAAPHPLRILLVEDRDMVRHTLTTMLTRRGHNVIAYNDGLIALDILRERVGEIDAVITDYTMPSINGDEFVREIRTDFPLLPVIVMSGDSTSLDDLQANFKDKRLFLLAKPVMPEELDTLLAQLD